MGIGDENLRKDDGRAGAAKRWESKERKDRGSHFGARAKGDARKILRNPQG